MIRLDVLEDSRILPPIGRDEALVVTKDLKYAFRNSILRIIMCFLQYDGELSFNEQVWKKEVMDLAPRELVNS